MPTAPTTSAGADAIAGADALDAGHGENHDVGQGHGKHDVGQAKGKHADGQTHDKHVVQRTKPVDVALAKKNLSAVMEMFGGLRRDQVTFRKPGGTHGRLSDAQRQAFEQKHPGLTAPKSVVFPKEGKGDKPIGVVFSDKSAPIELGMGNSHQHKTGGVFMEHIWFAPDDLALAFSDTDGGANKRVNQLVNGGGAPAK